MKGKAGVRISPWHRRVALGVSTVLVGALLQGVAASAADAAGNLPGAPPPGKPVAGKEIGSKPRKIDPAPRVPGQAPRASWSPSGKSLVELTGGPTAAGGRENAGSFPLSLFASSKGSERPPGSPDKAEVRVLEPEASRRAQVDGPLFVITPAPGKSTAKSAAPTNARVRIDYSGYAQAFGGGYASRLRLVELPSCAITSPDKAACRTAKPLATKNDTEKQVLTADQIALRAGNTTVLAAAPAASGEKGDYKATPLSPSATWKTDLNSGAFSWSYDIPVPDVPGAMKPNIGLSYSSSTIDGRTGNTNNQSSWVGDGFDMWPGFIERRYKPCYDDGEKHDDGNKPGDLCWAYDNAFISFNGKAGELVPAGGNEFKLKNDDGTRIARLSGSEHDNGDNDNEYWRLTTPGGTRYYFGYHKLNGWTKGKDTTDSTWTVPVYGNNSGEPCHKTGFKDSWCQQAWRWNLDYAVDRHGNAVGYYYGKETNSYGRDLEKKDDTPYARGGYLKRIEYGLKSADLYAKPLAKVDFSNAERCLPQDKDKVTCAENTIDDKKAYWYDTPWDLNCKEGTECDKGRFSPSFWTRKRLTEVSTSVLKNDGKYAPVDSWKLNHRWGTADIDYQLLLDSVQHTGQSASPAITLPKTTFAYTQRTNRLDKTGDGKAPFIKERLSTIADEFGGQTDVVYSQPACEWAKLPTPESNTTRCFPQFIGGSSSDDPTQQWFNKYVVEAVAATDRTGGAPDQVTRYDYLDGSAWHYDDDDGLTKEKFKTWSQWRGYGHVRVQKGGQGADAMKSQEDSYFLRGMDGDRKDSDGGKKSVSTLLSEEEGGPIADHESAAGFTYRTETYSGPGGKVLSKTVSRPWHHETGKRERSWGTVTANFTGTESSRAFTSLDGGAGEKWRQTRTATEYDTKTGRAKQVDDFGDTETDADDRCTQTTYADNPDANIFSLPSRAVTVAASCDKASSVDRTKAVVSDVRTAYDGGTYGAAPTKGDATSVATLKKDDGQQAVYLESGKTYDGYGRELSTTDLTADVVFDRSGERRSTTKRTDGRTTTTAYSPATGFPDTVTATAPPAKAGDPSTAWTSTTTLDPLRGQPLSKTDANDRRTDFDYDALGRSTKVWLPNKAKGAGGAPSLEFVYYIAEGKPAAVATRTLNDNYGQLTSYTIYDGLRRPRQTQAPGPDGGRLLTDTFYDERGLATKSFATYYALGAPATTLFAPDDALKVESQTWTAYDGLGRATETKQIAGNSDAGKVLSTTRTVYGGDRTTVIPPVGSTATTTVIDARGQTTELRQHHDRGADGEADVTRYAYGPTGKLTKFTDPAGNAWTYTYDQLGRQVSSEDPDKGPVTSTYDDRGQLISVTNSRKTKNTLYYAYDNLGRKTELREGSTSGTKLAEWTYDTVNRGKGQPATSTRFENGNAYTNRIDEYDSLYRATRSRVAIPSNEGALAGEYYFGTTYNPSGSVQGVMLPKAGSLSGDGIVYTYDKLLRPTEVVGSGGLKASVTSYSLTGKPLQAKVTGGGKVTQLTNGYEWGTQRLATTRVDRENAPTTDKAATYTYDETGNVRAVSDAASGGLDTQCFTYDYLRRVTDEWTQPTPSCSNAPDGKSIGGPAPYWNSYTYDKTGNRLTETRHDTGGDSAKDTRRTYSYPPAGGPQPHTLTAVDTTAPTGTAKDSYAYDSVGNTTTRTIAGDKQTLDWDVEGHLAKAVQFRNDKVADSASYVYDADGQRLIGRTDTETTLYLGATEITLAKGAKTPKATRYLDLGNGVQAVQNDDGSGSFVVGDHVGTGQLAIDAKDTSAAHRRTTPFGSPRGEQPKNWPGTKGFVGGTNDTTTGLTHLGAREYDPTIGRFISVDPVMDLGDPQQNHGYTYAHNNPATLSDPSGLMPGDCWAMPRMQCTKRSDGGWDQRMPEDPGPTKNDEESDERADSAGSWTGGCGDECGGGSEYSAPPQRPTEKEHQPWAMGTNPNYHNPGDRTVSPPASIPDVVTCTSGDTMCKLRVAWYKNSALFGSMFGTVLSVRSFAGARGKGAARSSGGVPCEHSFTTGTDVLLDSGASKPIEEIKTGDKVLAADPETGKLAPREVVATFNTRQDKSFTDLTIDTGHGAASIIATDNHPFWETTEKKWVSAGDLRPGSHLLMEKGESLRVKATRHFVKQQRTHDLTVSGVHTYHVLAGTAPVLVHNCDGAVLWVKENANMSSEARAYDAGAAGSRSGVAPALQYYKADAKSLSQIKFDGFDAANGVLIDRKMSVTTFNKTYRQAMNQSLALEQNGYTGRWEVPNAAEAARARSLLGRLLITNIRVRVVP
ncbi:polymorphic toxin-type HINT domain-containing protein [Streptomyces mobaraensis]|uniref:polymorphic toxin-type HINT domain-containing protein n=1 Tax=Streptomyces mobaraensis TaxID=35621 RepID=UPI003F4CD6D2